jgi:hypothetical protein
MSGETGWSGLGMAGVWPSMANQRDETASTATLTRSVGRQLMVGTNRPSGRFRFVQAYIWR